MFRLLELLGTDTGRDADHLLPLFDALPDARTRRAFLRALRSAACCYGTAGTLPRSMKKMTTPVTET